MLHLCEANREQKGHFQWNFNVINGLISDINPFTHNHARTIIDMSLKHCQAPMNVSFFITYTIKYLVYR